VLRFALEWEKIIHQFRIRPDEITITFFSNSGCKNQRVSCNIVYGPKLLLQRQDKQCPYKPEEYAIYSLHHSDRIGDNFAGLPDIFKLAIAHRHFCI